MLMSDYKVGGWGEKRPKTCLRNIWMVPNCALSSSNVLESSLLFMGYRVLSGDTQLVRLEFKL